MATVRHLERAPITEALIDFRVTLPPEFQPERLKEARTLLTGRYPKCEERKGYSTNIHFGEGTATQDVKDLGFQGLWLKTEDEKTIAQFRIDGFTLNRLQPYDRWDVFVDEALAQWRMFATLSGAENVVRIAVRYINHLPLPPEARLDEYLLAEPRLPEGVPEILITFATQVLLHHPERNMSAMVRQLLEPKLDAPGANLVLDIDAFKTGQFAVDVETLREHLEALRTYKNSLFFGSLTDPFVQRFQ